jgi:hypothetical protein
VVTDDSTLPFVTRSGAGSQIPSRDLFAVRVATKSE